MIMIMTVMPVVAATEFVVSRNTGINGNPVLLERTLSMFPTQKAKVMIMTRPVMPLMASVHTIARGRVLDASLLSSAILKNWSQHAYFFLFGGFGSYPCAQQNRDLTDTMC